jgi:hypothetical protein
MLILLGFVCQGLTWDGYSMVLVNVALWFACVLWPRKPLNLPQYAEGLLLLAGCAGGFALARAFGQSTHFVIGHGITLVQAARLMRPLTERDKRFSLIAAFLHIGVGCTVVLDFRFVAILLGAVWLIPGALREMAGAVFPLNSTVVVPRRRFAVGQFILLLTAAVLVFTLFPRGLLGSGGVPLPGASSASLMDAMLDPSSGGFSQSGRVIFEIRGDNIGYLRSLALVEFDGEMWRADPRPALKRLDYQPLEVRKGHKQRLVRVKNVAHLGKLLPTDGHVIGLAGTFFSYPLQDNNENIHVNSAWTTGNASYEYWIDEPFGRKWIYPQEAKALLQHPEPSPEVRRWITNVVGVATDPFARARKLEAYLQENFTYRIGAPRLNRVNLLDEFLLETREGHCERFASALALLLRMEGIPSRVMVGYVADQQNALSGWRPVRFKDAHAWTEAWFEGKGWVLLDATPRRTMQRSAWDPETWMENVDFVWNVYVVNFDGPAQRELMRVGTESVGNAFAWLHERAGWLTAILVVLLAVALWRRRNPAPETVVARKRQRQLAHAADQYGKMLALFEKLGFARPAEQTPLEFLQRLRQGHAPALSEAEFITQHFCALRYGGVEDLREKEVEEALQRMKRLAKRMDQRNVVET